MKKNQTFDVSFCGNLEREQVVGMPPTDTIDILFRGVRSIMNEYVRISNKIENRSEERRVGKECRL